MQNNHGRTSGGFFDHPLGRLITRGASGNLALRVLGLLTGFGLHIIIARAMDDRAYGVFALVITFATLIALFVSVGMDKLWVRLIPQYSVSGQIAQLNGVLVAGVVVTVLVHMVTTAGIYLALSASAVPITTTSVYWALIAGTITALPYALGNLSQSLLRGMKYPVMAELPRGPFFSGIMLVGAALLIYIVSSPSVVQMVVLTFIAACLAAALPMILMGRNIRLKLANAKPQYSLRVWLSTSVPLGFISGRGVLLSQTDIVMLGLIAGPADAGYYSAASRLSQVVVFALLSANVVIAPLVSEAHTQGRLLDFGPYLKTSVRIVALITAIGVALLVLVGKQILAIFGDAFVNAYPALIVLLIGCFFNAALGPTGLLLTMTGQEGVAARILGWVAVVNILANLVAIPYFGLIGAALATSVSMIVWNVLMLIEVRKRLGLSTTVI